jgi:penicillin-binding protein 2
MGIDKISQYAKAFGLGEKTGIEVFGESKGVVSSKEYIEEQNKKGAKLTWTIGDTLSSAIGQSYNLYTPLQMAYYISTIANSGKRTDLTIIKDIKTRDEEQLNAEEVKKEIKELVGASTKQKEDVNVSKETLEAVFEGMKSVTGDRGGTVYGTFNDLPFEVAGKTGTATSGNGSDNAWFVGFAPYDDPQIAVVVIVEHGGHGYFTAKAVKDIMKVYFKLDDDKNVE